MYYYSQTHKFKSQIANRRKDAVNQSSISVTDLKTIDVPVPPREEQERIVAELDCLSGVIEKKKQQLKELDALAQSIFYQMFGDEVGQSNKWDSCSIGDIYKFQYGKGNKIPESKGEYPCYGSNGQVGYHTEFNGEDSPIIGHIGAYAGIVIWARGKHYVTYNGVICKLKHKGFHPIYGYYLLKAQNYMDSARGGPAQPFVSYDMLEAPIVYMPPLTLRQEFADKIEKIEQQKKLISQSIKEVEDLFNSRMNYYFN
jgi:type I restriction enzyme S subunit